MTQFAYGYPPAARWTPARLGGGLCLWLDASDAGTIVIGTGIATWHDKSPAKNHLVQATGANQPALTVQGLNGRNVVTFDGSNDCFTTTPAIVIPASLDLALFAVMAPTATGGYHNILDNAASVPMLWVDGFDNLEWNRSTGSGGISSTASVNGSFAQYGCLAKSASQEVWKNGAAAGTAASTPLTAGTVTPTIFNRGGASTFNGKVAELIMVNRLIDVPTRQAIEGYLAAKWGLRAALPATHPYRNSAP